MDLREASVRLIIIPIAMEMLELVTELTVDLGRSVLENTPRLLKD
jgi:hypothetical protein